MPSEADAARALLRSHTHFSSGASADVKATPTSSKREISVDNEVVALARKHLYAHTITQEQFDIVKGRHGKSHIEKTWSRKDMDKRARVVGEILQTEQDYCVTLGALVHAFAEPSRALVEDDQHRIIFQNASSILGIHMKFASDLENAVRARATIVN